jgi:putative salt-induced outer membrane protein
MKHHKHLSAATLAALAGSISTTAPAQEAAKPADAPKWKQSAGVGFSLTQGNSETVLFTANYSGSKKWRQNEVAIGLNGGYGENNNVRNNEFIKAFGQYNWLFGQDRRWYGFGRLDGLYDGIADIDYRINVSGGLGYYFLKEGVNENTRFNLSAELGPGFVTEQVGGLSNDYATLYVGEKFTWKISDRSRLWQSVEYTPQLDSFENGVINFEVGVASKLTDKMELRTVLTDTYRSEPAAGRKHNDLKFVTSISYTF